MNNTDAEIFVGQEKYFTLLSGQASNPYYTLQSIKAGVTLKVTPSVGKEGGKSPQPRTGSLGCRRRRFQQLRELASPAGALHAGGHPPACKNGCCNSRR